MRQPVLFLITLLSIFGILFPARGADQKDLAIMAQKAGMSLEEMGGAMGDYITGAHGDPETGVFRLNGQGGLPYAPPGSCTHCHDIHAYPRNGHNLFMPYETNAEKRDLCFSCHSGNLPPPNPPTPSPPPAAHGASSDVLCTQCHDAHDPSHGGGGGGDCADCHGYARSHATHTLANSKGPATPLTCNDCHSANIPLFRQGGSLAATRVCDNCHSEGGAYNGLNDVGASIGAKDNWDAVYTEAGDALLAGKEKWCSGCHDGGTSTIGGVAAPNVDLHYVSGHGAAGIACLDCHDVTRGNHIDTEPRTFTWTSAGYGPSQCGIGYADGYRLSDVNGDVPLMIPANYNITFSYNSQVMKENAFRLCFECHDMNKIFDDTPGNGIDSNFKASQPNPPRNYSYAWGSGADVNEHVSHIMNYTGPFCDSDWDASTTGPGGQNGRDALTGCYACHNVHGAVGLEGSTNEVMVRDGRLAGRGDGYGFSYVIEDASGYPWVTSTGATQANSVGAILRLNTDVNSMCGGGMCHGNPTPPAGATYDASGSSWGTYLEYFRPWALRDESEPTIGQVTVAVRNSGQQVELAWECLAQMEAPQVRILRAGQPHGDVPVELISLDATVGSPQSYRDDTVTLGATYYYWIETDTPDGGVQRLGPWGVTVLDPGGPRLLWSGPNPVREAATIRFFAPSNSRAQLQIFAIGGGLVRSLQAENLRSGSHEFVWDRRDQGGRPVPKGMYLFKLRVDQTNLPGGRLIVLD